METTRKLGLVNLTLTRYTQGENRGKQRVTNLTSLYELFNQFTPSNTTKTQAAAGSERKKI